MFTGHPSVEETILRIQSAMKPIERRSTWAVLILGVLFFGSPSLTMGQSVSQRPECTGVLHGTVSDRDGKPVSDISVVAYPLGVDIEGLLARTNTNQAGEYRFEHVCPGTYATFPDDQKAGSAVSNVWGSSSSARPQPKRLSLIPSIRSARSIFLFFLNQLILKYSLPLQSSSDG